MLCWIWLKTEQICPKPPKTQPSDFTISGSFTTTTTQSYLVEAIWGSGNTQTFYLQVCDENGELYYQAQTGPGTLSYILYVVPGNAYSISVTLNGSVPFACAFI